MIAGGIDPGKKGALVVLGPDHAVLAWWAADHPEHGYVRGKTYLPATMRASLAGVGDLDGPHLVGLEVQQAYPHEGRSSCFTTGFGYGLWEGLVCGVGLPYATPRPRAWQVAVLGPSRLVGDERKARAIKYCQARIPDLPLTWGRRRKPHDGLADAGCIAAWALQEMCKARPPAASQPKGAQ